MEETSLPEVPNETPVTPEVTPEVPAAEPKKAGGKKAKATPSAEAEVAPSGLPAGFTVVRH